MRVNRNSFPNIVIVIVRKAILRPGEALPPPPGWWGRASPAEDRSPLNRSGPTNAKRSVKISPFSGLTSIFTFGVRGRVVRKSVGTRKPVCSAKSSWMAWCFGKSGENLQAARGSRQTFAYALACRFFPSVFQDGVDEFSFRIAFLSVSSRSRESTKPR